MGSSVISNRALTGNRRVNLAGALTLLLIFICGGVVGALVMDTMIHNRTRTVGFDSIDGKAAYFAKVEKDLNLSSQQAAQMESILNDFWQYYRTVLSDGKQRIEQILTPEQKTKFERMLQENK
jgi:hypothetical protein